MKRAIPKIVLGALATLTFTACAGDDEAQLGARTDDAGDAFFEDVTTDGVSDASEEVSEDISITPRSPPESFALPGLIAMGDCDPSREPWTLTEWAALDDAVAFGTVSELRPAGAPWYTTNGAQAVDECEEPARHGIDVVLTNLRSDIPGQPNTLVMRVTAESWSIWELSPAVIGDAVAWFDETALTGVVVGMRIGGLFARSPREGTYLSAGTLFWAESDDILRWQPGRFDSTCIDARPPELDGATIDEVFTSLNDATREEGSEVSEGAAFWWSRSSACADDPPNGTPCIEIEPGQIDCPVGLECNLETMMCEPAP